MCSQHRGKVKDRSQSKLIAKRQANRKFHEQMDELINLVSRITSYEHIPCDEHETVEV